MIFRPRSYPRFRAPEPKFGFYLSISLTRECHKYPIKVIWHIIPLLLNLFHILMSSGNREHFRFRLDVEDWKSIFIEYLVLMVLVFYPYFDIGLRFTTLWILWVILKWFMCFILVRIKFNCSTQLIINDTFFPIINPIREKSTSNEILTVLNSVN